MSIERPRRRLSVSVVSLLAAAVAGAVAASPARAQATIAPETGKNTPAYTPKRQRDIVGNVTGPLHQGWWNDAVFYQVFVRSFKDSGTGPLAKDGIGDIQGLIDKLDYLNDGNPDTTSDLGVTALWLMPMHPSPSYHGYDVTDYYDVNPQYGTLDDFRRLTEECHKRGIKIVIDLVLNHCSAKHPWFIEAQDPKSPKHDWFIFKTPAPSWKGPWNQNVWHQLRSGPSQGQHYYGIFSREMPDIDYANAEASKAMLDVVKFWIDPKPAADGPAKGKPIAIDGYRLDAIRHLIEDGKVQENTLATHEWLKQFHTFYKGVKPDAFTIGEVWTSSELAAPFVGDQLDAVFEFDLSYAMVDAAKTGKAQKLIDAQEKVLKLYPPNQYGRFLTNHDQTRVMNELKSNEGAMRSAAQMLLLGPGIPFIYYGEELGMTGAKPDPDIRTPMPWTKERNAGFSDAAPWKAVNKTYREVNVETESREAGSLLTLYRKLVHLRNRTPALRFGDYRAVKADNPGVYAFIRSRTLPLAADAPKDAKPKTDAVLVVLNLTDKALGRISMTMPEGTGFVFGKDLLDDAFAALPFPTPIETLGAHQSRVIVLETPAPVVTPASQPASTPPTPTITR